MPKGSTKRRKRYTAKRRQEILTIADRDGLTATDVQKRFGVIPVTYYSWRKKSKAAGIRPGARGVDPTSKNSLRKAVRSKLERQLPRIVDEEVNRYLSSIFGRG